MLSDYESNLPRKPKTLSPILHSSTLEYRSLRYFLSTWGCNELAQHTQCSKIICNVICKTTTVLYLNFFFLRLIIMYHRYWSRVILKIVMHFQKNLLYNLCIIVNYYFPCKFEMKIVLGTFYKLIFFSNKCFLKLKRRQTIFKSND